MDNEAQLEPAVEIAVVAQESDPRVERRELRRLLGNRPRRIPSRYFYDDLGSQIFDEITRLPEYYLTRAESEILQREAAHIAEITGATELVELGSGTSTKTRIVLDAMASHSRLSRYIPFDVSEPVVRTAATRLAAAYPGLSVYGIVGDFTSQLDSIPDGERRLVLLLGSTIGNFDLAEAAQLLRAIADPMRPGDAFLLGADLVKDVSRLEAAYNDSAGVTARFNLNVLEVVNRSFGGDFDPELFEHRALFDTEHEWIEMRLVARREHRVRLADLDLELELEAGEEILTEISSKYRREVIEGLLSACGFSLESWMTDSDELFALALARRL